MCQMLVPLAVIVAVVETRAPILAARMIMASLVSRHVPLLDALPALLNLPVLISMAVPGQRPGGANVEEQSQLLVRAVVRLALVYIHALAPSRPLRSQQLLNQYQHHAVRALKAIKALVAPVRLADARRLNAAASKRRKTRQKEEVLHFTKPFMVGPPLCVILS